MELSQYLLRELLEWLLCGSLRLLQRLLRMVLLRLVQWLSLRRLFQLE